MEMVRSSKMGWWLLGWVGDRVGRCQSQNYD